MAKINKDLFGGLARGIAENLEAESEAIKKYQELLTQIQSTTNSDYLFKVYDRAAEKEVDSPTAAADKKLFKLTCETIKEYIAEEMKHLKGLQLLYETMTGIKSETK